MKKKLEVIPLGNLDRDVSGGAGGVRQCTPDNPLGRPPQHYASEYHGGREGLPGVSGDGSRYPRSRQERYADLARRNMRNMRNMPRR